MGVWISNCMYHIVCIRTSEIDMIDHLVEIWGKPGCPYCERSKQICKKFGLNYIYHQLDEDFTREELLEKFPYAKSFPQIVVDGEYVGGHDDFVKYKNTILKDD